MNRKSIFFVFLIISMIYASISITRANQVTAMIKEMGDFSESGDGFSFTTKEGSEYYIYIANDYVKGGEYLLESQREGTFVCLTLDPKKEMGDITSVSRGACSNSSWYISTAKPTLTVRNSPAIAGKKIGSIPTNGKVKILERTDNKDFIGGKSGEWVKIEWKDSFGYVFDSFLTPVESIKTSKVVEEDGRKNKLELCEANLPDIEINTTDDAIYEYLESAKRNPDETVNYSDGMSFNECIFRNKKKIVEISIWLDDSRVEQAKQYLNENNQLYFYVPDGIIYDKESNRITTIEGSEYLLSMGDESADTLFMPYPRRLTTITGYFKVSSIVGPFQGVMSTHLKGVRIEDIY